MVCKYDDISAFFNQYPILEDIEERELKELFETFSHACKFVKELDNDDVNCNNLHKVAEKTIDILNDSYDHDYTKEDILNLAGAICKVFDIAEAPKYHVPFIIVLLAKL